jgi:hypothetical protein
VQNTVESSVFGSEFFATHITVEQIEALCYKIGMFGIPLDGPKNVFVETNLWSLMQQ